MVCGGQTSRFEVAQELLKCTNMTQSIKLTSVNSSFFEKEYFAERPLSERLVNKKLDLRNLNSMQNWKKSLAEYIKNYYEGYLD